LPLEVLVLADVTGHHLAHALRMQQEAHTKAVNPRIVADDGQVARATGV